MIYENVKRLCEQHHVSIFELERSCGIANGAIGKWQERTSSPRVLTLQKIANYFGVSVDELIAEKKTARAKKGKGGGKSPAL